MTDLKTLKDIEITDEFAELLSQKLGSGAYNFLDLINRTEIKKEAIKWVKMFRNCKQKAQCDVAVNFIKTFFEISEEELK